MMESAVAGLKKASERDLARFLVASHYYYGGHYDQAARVCKTIQEKRTPLATSDTSIPPSSRK